MTFEIALLVLSAAFLHAGWNALVKTASDRLVVISAVAFAQFLAGAVVIPFVAVPESASWPAIAWSTVVHFFYYTFLVQAYRFGDLSLVYPLARGLAPVLVATGATIFGNEILPPSSMAGVLIASTGIASIAFFQNTSSKTNPAAFFFAVGTGMMIAAYTVADGIGVRFCKNPFSYIAWLFFLEFPVFLFVLHRRRGRLLSLLRQEWKQFAGTGVSSVLAYGIVIYAVQFAPMATVSALRESSVIMAALIGTIFLGERPWQQRVGAAVIVAVGVSLITGAW